MNPFAEPLDTHWNERAARDLAIAAALVLTGGVVFTATDVTERVTGALLQWEALELDDLLLTLGLALISAGWFAWRRWSDSRAQLALLAGHARERASYVQQLEELSSALLGAEEREQLRLSEVLHDEIGQTLFGAKLQLDLAAASTDERAKAHTRHAAELLSSAMRHARDLSMTLHPPELDDLGLAAALQRALPRLEQRYDVRTRLDAGSAWEDVPRAARRSVFRSVHELVANAAKHGSATLITLSASQTEDGRICIQVADDGVGFDPAAETRGFGLFSIQRRMACLAGELRLTNAPDGGTSARLELPANVSRAGER